MLLAVKAHKVNYILSVSKGLINIYLWKFEERLVKTIVF